jgi:hypothetical protein
VETNRPGPGRDFLAKVIAVDAEGCHAMTAITKSLTLAARAIARMEAESAKVHAEANGSDRGFQAISSKEGFSAIIRHGKTLIEISGDDFAVRQTD